MSANVGEILVLSVVLVCSLFNQPGCARRAPGSASPPRDADVVPPGKAINDATLQPEPHVAWNTFVEIVALTSYERLDPRQRPAHLVFWYDAEVQNGGHYQYFVNSAGRRAREAVGALKQLGLVCQAGVLNQALASWTAKARKPPRDGREFVDNARADEFDRLDAAFHACSPSVQRGLEIHLDANRELFVVAGGAAQPAAAPDGASPRR